MTSGLRERYKQTGLRPLICLLALAAIGVSQQQHGLTPYASAKNPPSTARLTLARLETNAAAQPLGIDDRAPRLSWMLISGQRGVMQTAYRVLVASKLELAGEGKADIWDSRQISSADSWAIYAGPPLNSRTRYFWTVRVWATDRLASNWAQTEWFETALLSTSEWKGQWIAGPDRPRLVSEKEGIADDDAIRRAGEFCRPTAWLTSGFAAQRVKNNQGECRDVRPAPLLRKLFQVSRPVVRARVYSSGLAYNHLTVNGKPASESVLDPGFTDYSRTVLYTTHDVTALLRQGRNVIASELGSGHYDDETRTWDWGWEQAEWRATPRLRLDLYWMPCRLHTRAFAAQFPRSGNGHQPASIFMLPFRRMQPGLCICLSRIHRR